MIILQILSVIFLAIGAAFLLLGALGLVRMPDVYNKLQAGTKATTLGFLSVGLGALLVQPGWALRIIVIMLLVLLTNPIGSHALARAARNSGIDMVTGERQKKEKA